MRRGGCSPAGFRDGRSRGRCEACGVVVGVAFTEGRCDGLAGNEAVGALDVQRMRVGRSAADDAAGQAGVIIGETAKYVREDDALNYVAGNCTVHDVSEREFQLEHGGQWTKGKSCDTFGPIGPWLVTTDEVPNPQNLRLWLEVDGHRFQNGCTKTMVFGVKRLVSYLSQFMSLHPGDIISTGTPSGVKHLLAPRPNCSPVL